MNIHPAFRRFASIAFVIALFALTANSTFAYSLDPSDEAAPIIIVGG
jgi:hypothetical protein